MYQEFRNINDKLPGDDEQNLNKPNFTLHLEPFDTYNVDIALPSISTNTLVVPENMTIEVLGEYVYDKLNLKEGEVEILYNNQKMTKTFTMKYIKDVYGADSEGKFNFFYVRKEQENPENSK